MAKLPFRKLKIGPHKWDIKFAPLNDEDHRSKKYKKEMEGCGKHAVFFGETDFEKTLIRLNENMDEEMMGEVIVHEIIHIAIDECNLRAQIKVGDEEQIVQNLGVWLLMAFRDNPCLKDIIFPPKKNRKKR